MQKIPFSQLRQNVQKLPRLPIPSLDDTLQRYKASVEPLKSPESVKAHLAKMDKFRGESAQKLQKVLIAEDKAAAAAGEYPFSYIEPLWDAGYLEYRGPSPINIAPAFSTHPIGKNLTQCEVASRIMVSVYKYIRRMVTEGVEVSADAPGDVSQLANQFAFARMPGKTRDSFFQADLATARTFTVLRDGNIYVVRIADDNGKVFPLSTICGALQHILKVTPMDNTAPVSVLTSWNRDMWFAARDALSQNPNNKRLLEEIDRSIAVVCLDHVVWGSDVLKKQQAMLHGGEEEHENRWYDKHQIIVSADGQLAFNFEHCFSDGMTWSTWVKDVYCDLTGSPSLPAVPEAAGLTAKEAKQLVTPITLEFGKSGASSIREAREATKELIKGVKLVPIELEFGKSQIKKLGLSPDAFFQIAFHMAYYNVHQHIAPTYESCSTRSFFHGRTETIRTASRAVAEFLRDGEKGSLSKHLCLAAAKTHVALAKEASAGQGVDRHLLALKHIAEKSGDKVALDFFNDKLYKHSSTWHMSTSNVSQPFLEYFNFGPVAANGYGLGYNIGDKETRVVISSFEASEVTDAARLSDSIAQATAMLQKLLAGEEVERKGASME